MTKDVANVYTIIEVIVRKNYIKEGYYCDNLDLLSQYSPPVLPRTGTQRSCAVVIT